MEQVPCQGQLSTTPIAARLVRSCAQPPQPRQLVKRPQGFTHGLPWVVAAEVEPLTVQPLAGENTVHEELASTKTWLDVTDHKPHRGAALQIPQAAADVGAAADLRDRAVRLTDHIQVIAD